jgi:uncharacterized membrane protein YeaQ/YmgE (transglycosylase-associated protein family)
MHRVMRGHSTPRSFTGANMLIGLIAWVILGLLAGFIASKVLNLRGDDPQMGIIFGGGGALVGGILYSIFSGNPISVLNIWALIVATVGAVAALAGWHITRHHTFSRY